MARSIAPKFVLPILAASVAATVLTAPQPTYAADLKFAFPAPAVSYLNRLVFTPWAKKVGEASGGTLNVKIFAGPVLGTFRNIYPRTVKGVADICFGIFGPIYSSFPKSQVASLPVAKRTAREAAIVLWRMANGSLKSEFTAIKPLAMFTFPDATIHLAKPVKRVEDIKGLKLSVSTKLIGQVVHALGAAPVFTQPTETYLSISRGVIDGIVTTWNAVHTFKLNEVTSYHIEGQMGLSPAFVVMNKASYAKLPAKAKKAIDDNIGEQLSARLGALNDEDANKVKERLSKEKDRTIVEVSGQALVHWNQAINKVVDAWAKDTPGGAKVIAEYKAELARVRAGK